MSVSVDWKPKRAVQAKIRDIILIDWKNPQGRSMQKLRIKRQSNCIRSGTVNLGHPIIRRPLIRSICKSTQIKDLELGQFKVVKENSGYCVQCTLPIYLPFSKFFKDLWSHAIGGSPLNSSNLSLCPFIWNSHLFYLQNIFNFWWQYLK